MIVGRIITKVVNKVRQCSRCILQLIIVRCAGVTLYIECRALVLACYSIPAIHVIVFAYVVGLSVLCVGDTLVQLLQYLRVLVYQFCVGRVFLDELRSNLPAFCGDTRINRRPLCCGKAAIVKRILVTPRATAILVAINTFDNRRCFVLVRNLHKGIVVSVRCDAQCRHLRGKG